MLEDIARGRGLAVAIYADHRAVEADILAPEIGNASFHRDSRNSVRQNGFSVIARLAGEDRRGRHGHDTYANSSFGKLLLRAQLDLDLRPGHDDPGARIPRLLEHVGARPSLFTLTLLNG